MVIKIKITYFKIKGSDFKNSMVKLLFFEKQANETTLFY